MTTSPVRRLQGAALLLQFLLLTMTASAVELRIPLTPHRATVHPTSAMLHLGAEVPVEAMAESGEVSHTIIFANLTSLTPDYLEQGQMDVSGGNTTLEQASLQVGFSGDSTHWLSVQRIEWADIPIVPDGADKVKKFKEEAANVTVRMQEVQHRLELLKVLDSDYKTLGGNLVTKDTLLSLIKTTSAGDEETTGAGSKKKQLGVTADLDRVLKSVLPSSIARVNELRAETVPQRQELDYQLSKLRERQHEIQKELAEVTRTARMAKVHLQFDQEGFKAWQEKKQPKDSSNDTPVNATVWASTIVSAVRWRPSYEFRFNTSDDTVEINYHAQVYQQTPLAWENVTLELCTGEPTFGRKAPELEEWNIALRSLEDIRNEKARKSMMAQQQYSNNIPGQAKKMKMKMPQQQRSSMMNQAYRGRRMESASMSDSGSISDEEEEVEEDFLDFGVDLDEAGGGPPELSSVISSGVSDVFALSTRHSLPSSQEVRLPITTMTLKSNVSYVAVPKLSTKVFIQARVLNKSPFTLLPGSALLFADGNFISTTNIPLLGTDASTSMDVGIEPKMSVKRKLLFQNDTQIGGMFSAKTTVRDFRYSLMIQSKRSTAIDVLVKDALPKTNDEKLGVFLKLPAGLVESEETAVRTLRADKTVKPPSKAESEAEAKKLREKNSFHDGDALVYPATIKEVTLTRSGQLRWLMEAAAGQTVEVPFHFSVGHAPEFGVSGLDDV